MMSWNDQFDKIQPGDVFVKPWGDHEIVHVMLPKTRRSNKQPYMILSRGYVESTWNERRSTYHNASNERRFRFVGTVPTAHLTTLFNNWTLR